jgi:hypothetical protein
MKASSSVMDAITKVTAAEPDREFTFAELTTAIYGQVIPSKVTAVRIAAQELVAQHALDYESGKIRVANVVPLKMGVPRAPSMANLLKSLSS